MRVHNKLGIKAAECEVASFCVPSPHLNHTLTDGLAGEVLLHAIKKVVGPQEYTATAHNGWLKIYSAMLEIIVPEVVRFEIEHREEAIAILHKRTGNVMSGATNSMASLVTIAMPVLGDGVSGRSAVTQRSSNTTPN